MPERTIGAAIVGTGFVAEIHAASFRRVHGAEVRAVLSRDPERARAFASRHGIPRALSSLDELLALEDVELLSLCVPNDLHADFAIRAARAGKHVVVEKPIARNLEEADAMIAAGREAGVHLFYAEELCFAPKYVRAKELVDAGAVGEVHLVKQAELHDGPHADWFWDVERSGGGVTLDMGCHAIEFMRWILDKRPIRSVYAEMGTRVHRARTRGDDQALIIVEFEGGAVGLAEESWAKPGGMEDRAEIYGSEGVIYADLLRGSSLLTYSERGYDYAVEKAGTTKGWTFTMFDEAWNYGFPQELQHFTDVLRFGGEPKETAEDGRAVLEAILAAYASAREGRKIALPFRPRVERPIDLWLGAGD